MGLSKGWKKVLIGAGLLVASPFVVVCAAELAVGATVATLATTVGTALVAKGTDEVCEE